jgi:tetratricopeptide (TPR) repeat protein
MSVIHHSERDDGNPETIPCSFPGPLIESQTIEGLLAITREGGNCMSTHPAADPPPEILYKQLSSAAVMLGKPAGVRGVIAVIKERAAAHPEFGHDMLQGIAGLYNTVATALRQQNQFADALLALAESEALLRRIDDKVNLAIGLENKARLQTLNNEFESLLATYEEIEQIYRDSGNTKDLQRIIGDEAQFLLMRGDTDRAMALVAEQTGMARESGDNRALLFNLDIQTKVMVAMQDFPRALEIFDEMESIALQIGDKTEIARLKTKKGLLLVGQNEHDQALPLFAEAETRCRECGDKEGLANAIAGRAIVAQTKGELERALELHRETGRLFHELQNGDGIVKSMGSQALLMAQLGRAREALPMAEQAVQYAGVFGFKPLVDGMLQPILDFVRAENQKVLAAEQEARMKVAMEAQLRYMQELAKWNALPLLKRVMTKKPQPPF